MVKRLKTTWKRACADVLLLRFNIRKCERNKTVVEDWFFVLSGKPSVAGTSAVHNAKVLTLLQNSFTAEILLRLFDFRSEKEIWNICVGMHDINWQAECMGANCRSLFN